MREKKGLINENVGLGALGGGDLRKCCEDNLKCSLSDSV